MEKKPKVKKKKLDTKQYLEEHPELKQKLQEITEIYSESLHKIFEENEEVDANVKINFELLLK